MVPKVKSQYSLEDLQALYERIPKLYRERIEKWRAAQQRSIDDSLTPAQRQQTEEEATNLEQWLKGTNRTKNILMIFFFRINRKEVERVATRQDSVDGYFIVGASSK